MTSDERLKARIRLVNEDDPAALRKMVIRLLDALDAVRVRTDGPGNYEVQCYANPKLYRGGDGWRTLHTGTKDWAIGYAEALDARSDAVGVYRVVVGGNGGSIIWPDDRYLDVAEQFEPGDAP